MKLKKILKEYNNDLNDEVIDTIDNMHKLFNKLKNDGTIGRALTRRLFTDFKPLFVRLTKISNEIMKRKK